MYDLTRRELLKAGGLGLASLMLPRWLVRAVGEAQLGDRCPKTLVLVMLGGGNDGLNTVAPLADPLYAKLRPTLAIPRRDLLALNDSVGFHPGLRKLRDLFEKGRVAVLQNVGYPHQNHSHFASMEIWQTGRTDGVIHDGWVGRTLDRCGCDGPLHSLAFGSEIPLALWGEGAGVLTLDNPGAFELARDARHKGDSDNIFHALRAVYAEPRAGEAEYVRARSMELLGQVDRVKSLTGAPPPATGYPKGALPDGLRFIANAIEADLGARVYMIGLGGFDTHANQRGQHQNLLTTLGDALHAFQTDLEARGIADHVLTMTFSEFGRRAKENGSQGTDHGSAAPLFMVGKKVRGGVYGNAPELDKLDNGDVAWKIDFRQVYATVLKRWMGVDPDPLLEGKFATIDALA